MKTAYTGDHSTHPCERSPLPHPPPPPPPRCLEWVRFLNVPLSTPHFETSQQIDSYYPVVTPLRKAASYEPRIAILLILGDVWLTRSKYGIYVAVRGSYGAT